MIFDLSKYSLTSGCLSSKPFNFLESSSRRLAKLVLGMLITRPKNLKESPTSTNI